MSTLRKLITLLALIGVAGCATTQPAVKLSAQQQKFRDQEVKLLFARLIANHSRFGASNILIGQREYINARVSLPSLESGSSRRICAKVYIKNLSLLLDREVDLSAQVFESGTDIRLTMTRNDDLFGSRCSGPYVPFPELEARAPKAT